MNQKNLYKKDDIINEEEEPIPEKYSPSKKTSKILFNKSEILSKSNKKPKTKNKMSKLLNSTNNNISHITRAKTTINNLDTSKFENFNIQNQLYAWQKTYLCLHPDIDNSFMKRMEFDVYKRKIKEKEINKLIEDNKLKIEEEQRTKAFNRLYKDANRRIEAMGNLEKVKSILNNNNIISEEPLKKYSDEQWKKIYEERFKNYMEKINQKKEKNIKINIEQKIKRENDEVNLCKVKKASKKHIEKEMNKLYTEGMKRKMKTKVKMMRLKNNNKYIFEDEDNKEDYDAKKYKKKIKEKPYNFINDDNSKNKSIDISNYIIEKNSNSIQSVHESKNTRKILENSSSNHYKENNNKNDDMNKSIEDENINQKKIKYNFFDEEQKKQKFSFEIDKNKQLNYINNIKSVNINNNNKIEDMNKKLYNNEISYIIDQFFLRNNIND